MYDIKESHQYTLQDTDSLLFWMIKIVIISFLDTILACRACKLICYTNAFSKAGDISKWKPGLLENPQLFCFSMLVLYNSDNISFWNVTFCDKLTPCTSNQLVNKELEALIGIRNYALWLHKTIKLLYENIVIWFKIN